MNVKPIKTDRDHKDALLKVQKLWNADPGTPAHDEMEVLYSLIEQYENIHYPIDPPDPIEAIKFRMEQQGLDRSALVPLLGGRSRVSEVLSRKKPLNKKMIKNLHTQLGIPYESLFGPPMTSNESISNPHYVMLDTKSNSGPHRQFNDVFIFREVELCT